MQQHTKVIILRQSPAFGILHINNSTSLQKISFKLIHKQLLLVVLIALVLNIFKGMHLAQAFFFGALTYSIPNLLFVAGVFSRKNIVAAKVFVVTFFIGEFFKLILSGILFLVIAKLLQPDTLYMMLGFITALVAFWILMAKFLSQPGVRV